MRIWFKEYRDTHLLKDMVVEDYSTLNRTKKIFEAIHKMSYEFDLAEPIWLDSNIREFKQFSKVRFRKDSFMEEVEFDFLEMQVIEED